MVTEKTRMLIKKYGRTLEKEAQEAFNAGHISEETHRQLQQTHS